MRYRDFVMDSARWDGFVFRPGDIIISTPPKCGTTWTQRMCSLLLGVEPGPDRPLSRISPWLEMQTRPLDAVLADLEAQEHRRFIKSHTPLDGLPWDDGVTYLAVGRDPRDVAVSWAHHMDNIDLERFVNLRFSAVGAADLAELMPDGPPPPPPEDPVERFWTWAHDAGEVGGLPALVRHLRSFWEARDRPNVHLFHYGDLQADLPAQVRRLAAALDVPIADDDVARIAHAAGFDAMRASADTLVPNRDHTFWKQDEGFFHKGTSGQWRALLSDADAARYEKLVQELGPPELLRWLHEGGPTV